MSEFSNSSNMVLGSWEFVAFKRARCISLNQTANQSLYQHGILTLPTFRRIYKRTPSTVDQSAVIMFEIDTNSFKVQSSSIPHIG